MSVKLVVQPKPQPPEEATILRDGTVRWYAEEFYRWMREMNFSPHTIRNRRCFFGKFLRWCEERGLAKPREVNQALIERFQRQLYQYRDPETGEGLSINGQRATGAAIRAFFKWMRRRGHLSVNPAAEIDLPRKEIHLQANPLTVEEVEKILACPDVSTARGLRDRAMLEVLFSSGIRRSELVHLTIYDINHKKGTLTVRQGKGKKDRVLPIGERAIAWVDQYVVDGRPALVADPDHGRLFVQNWGGAMAPKVAGAVVKHYVDQSGVGKKGSCHLFRHAMATALLENGIRMKHLQQMLGHEDLRSTQLYGKIAIRKLKEAHTRLHPAALLKREKRK